MTGEAPSHCGASGFGCTKPQVPARTIPNTTIPSPAADRTVPIGSSLTPGSGGLSTMRRDIATITNTNRTSPANTQRQLAYVVKRPPISGPAATAMAAADITSPYARGRSAGPKFVATSATTAGRMRAAPSPSRSDHPTSRKGSVGDERGHGAAASVHDAPDHERALSAEDLTDLPSGDHERGHDQRVERDGDLDAGHGRAEVLCHRGDGHVHDRAVQGHEELGQSQRHQDGAAGRCTPGPGLRISHRCQATPPIPGRPGAAPLQDQGRVLGGVGTSVSGCVIDPLSRCGCEFRVLGSTRERAVRCTRRRDRAPASMSRGQL